MQYSSPRTKLYSALFNKQIININISINDFIKYGYYDVLIDVAETTNDMDYFVNIINMIQGMVANNVIFSSSSDKNYNKEFDIFYSNSKYLNKMYDLGKIKSDMHLYFILQQINNINSLKYIWACEYNKDNTFYTRMTEKNNNDYFGLSLASLFTNSSTYEFIKFFFGLDSVANWKVFICKNIQNIIYNCIISNEFNKILPIIVKYIISNSDLLECINDLERVIRNIYYNKNICYLYNLLILLKKINMIHIANFELNLSKLQYKILINYGHNDINILQHNRYYVFSYYNDIYNIIFI